MPFTPYGQLGNGGPVLVGKTGPQGPQGLPGVNAVPADDAVAGYITTTGTSSTKTALTAAYAALVGGVVPDSQLPRRLANSAFVMDANTALANGSYYTFAVNGVPPANVPYDGAWIIDVMVGGDNSLWVTQTAHQYDQDGLTDTRIYRRDKNNGTWTAWYRLRQSEAEIDDRYLTRHGGGRGAVASYAATSGPIPLNLDTANYFYAAAFLTGAVTPAFQNVPPGVVSELKVEYPMPSGAAYAVNLPTGGRWMGPAPTNVAGKLTVVTYISRDGGASWLCSALVQTT